MGVLDGIVESSQWPCNNQDMIVKDPDAMTFLQKENRDVSETTGYRSHPIQLFSIICYFPLYV
jgi:hypothetical protein